MALAVITDKVSKTVFRSTSANIFYIYSYLSTLKSKLSKTFWKYSVVKFCDRTELAKAAVLDSIEL